MRWLHSLILIPSLVLATVAEPQSEIFYVDTPGNDLEPMSPSFSLLYDQILESYSEFSKRDSFLSTLESLLHAVNDSGVIIDVLHLIADSPEEMNTLANYIVQILVSALTNNPIAGLNITVNLTEILDITLSSGIIESTLSGLAINDANRDQLADNVGSVLVNHTWIPKLIVQTGNTGKISWKTTFDLIQNTQSKDPGFNGTTYSKRELDTILEKRASNSSYSGSLNSFINNLVGSAIASDLFGESLDSILTAINNSGIVVPTVLSVTQDSKIQGMVGFIANKLYNYGLFDQIPINTYFQDAKKSGALSRTTQFLFGSPIWSPYLAKFFLRMDQQGVYQQIQKNLYGV